MLVVPELKVEPHLEHWIWTKVDYRNRWIRVPDENLKWNKVVPWFKLCHEGKIDVDEIGIEGSWERYDVKRAFQMVVQMRGLPWANVEKVLNLFKRCVEDASGCEAFDREWV